jgi:ribonuclease HI
MTPASGRADAGKHVQVHTDGACLGNPGPGGWAALLRYRGKERELAGGDAVKNRDLWERLHAACARHRIDWRWVKGHSGDPDNERVDQLARAQAIEYKTRIERGIDA